MKVLVAGAGPAGLYFAFLAKRARPDWDLRVLEQNPPDATFGFGVVFSERALGFLREDDPETCDFIAPRMEQWSDLVVVHRGTPVRIDGIGFSAIGRLELLRLMQQRVSSTGVTPEFGTVIRDERQLSDFDLVVAADGASSFVRSTRDFGTTAEPLTNKFAWFGTTKIYETLTQTFVETPDGTFNAHHYRHSPRTSTFVVECDAATWRRAGFAAMDEAATLKYCEGVFADALAGHPLLSNKSIWRNFPKVRNRRWVSGNTVLIGDAQRTAHFSIGSGTRLAMEDAISLNKALAEHADIREALAVFEAARRPIVEKLVAAADASGAWYERFPEHMRLAPREFAWSYIQRSGRIDRERLRQVAPRFVAGA